MKTLILDPSAAPKRLQTFYAFLPATGRFHAFRGIPTNSPESWWPASRRGFPSCASQEEANDALRYGLRIEAEPNN